MARAQQTAPAPPSPTFPTIRRTGPGGLGVPDPGGPRRFEPPARIVRLGTGAAAHPLSGSAALNGSCSGACGPATRSSIISDRLSIRAGAYERLGSPERSRPPIMTSPPSTRDPGRPPEQQTLREHCWHSAKPQARLVRQASDLPLAGCPFGERGAHPAARYHDRTSPWPLGPHLVDSDSADGSTPAPDGSWQQTASAVPRHGSRCATGPCAPVITTRPPESVPLRWTRRSGDRPVSPTKRFPIPSRCLPHVPHQGADGQSRPGPRHRRTAFSYTPTRAAGTGGSTCTFLRPVSVPKPIAANEKRHPPTWRPAPLQRTTAPRS